MCCFHGILAFSTPILTGYHPILAERKVITHHVFNRGVLLLSFFCFGVFHLVTKLQLDDLAGVKIFLHILAFRALDAFVEQAVEKFG
jgi:hypothetical protein